MKKISMILTFAFLLATLPSFSQVAVDLGLPSGTKWADRNVGASSPSDYGSYYAWGETSPKSNYSSDNYKIWKALNAMPDDNYDLDEKMTELFSDAAHAKWGGQWRTPSKEQIEELIEKCSYEWTKLNGVYGCKFIGPNGKNIFLPAAGYRNETKLYNEKTEGFYLSCSLEYSCPLSLWIDDEEARTYTDDFNNEWHVGYSIRPVCK